VNDQEIIPEARRPAHVLIVTEDYPLATLLSIGFTYEGFEVSIARSLSQVGEQMRRQRPDLVVLDIDLSGPALLDVCQRVRSQNNVGILVCIADPAPATVPTGANGPDDYLVKPVAFADMLARVHAVLDRRKLDLRRWLSAGDLILDRQMRRVTLAGRPLALTGLEFNLLELLLAHPGQIFSRAMIFVRVWGYDYFSAKNVVDVHIGHLRRKLGAHGRSLILTVGRRGYGLAPPDEPADPA
jgi:DNA-binding response OmpR family regulator